MHEVAWEPEKKVIMAMLPRMLSTLGQGVRRPLAQSLSTTGSLPFGAVSMYSWSTTMPSAPPAGT